MKSPFSQGLGVDFGGRNQEGEGDEEPHPLTVAGTDEGEENEEKREMKSLL